MVSFFTKIISQNFIRSTHLSLLFYCCYFLTLVVDSNSNPYLRSHVSLVHYQHRASADEEEESEEDLEEEEALIIQDLDDIMPSAEQKYPHDYFFKKEEERKSPLILSHV